MQHADELIQLAPGDLLGSKAALELLADFIE
jgi:hypothetical protein